MDETIHEAIRELADGLSPLEAAIAGLKELLDQGGRIVVVPNADKEDE